MNGASLELLSEQSSLFRPALIHSFQIFAIPTAHELLGTYGFLNSTSMNIVFTGWDATTAVRGERARWN